jgi:hypothetical protein
MFTRKPRLQPEKFAISRPKRPLQQYRHDSEEVLMAGLKLAQFDAERGSLDQERMQRIRDAVAEIVDDLSGHEDKREASAVTEDDSPLAHISKAEAAETPKNAAPELPEHWRTDTPVLCIPGAGLIDEAAAITLAQLIKRCGIDARAKEADALSMSKIFALDTKGVALVCLCYLENATQAQVRYAVRRIRRKAPESYILVSLLNGTEKIEDAEGLQLPPRAGLVHGSLADTLRKILEVASNEPSKRPMPELSLSESA